MTLVEDILSKRELLVFIGVEKHSTPYNPSLFNLIWNIPVSLPSKDILIIPIQGLGEAYKLSKDKISCYGKSFWILFVESESFTHYAFLFDAFAQTDDNSYFSDECISFLQKGNCCSITVCDMGVYKSRSLVKMLNDAIVSTSTLNISICLATILGYNTRGYTDIETEDEHKIYTKEFYQRSDIETKGVSDQFCFIQIDNKFRFGDLLQICCLTKSVVEIRLQKIKNEAKEYEKLHILWDYKFFHKTIPSFNKSESFDFKGLEKTLSNYGFKGELVDMQWTSRYEKLTRHIRNSKINDRWYYVNELISAIGNNIKETINYIKDI